LAYCIHIDRKTLGTRDISIKEWESIVNAHPEMELLSSIKGDSNTGNSIEIGGDGNAVWFIAERKIHFTYYEGRISTSETDHSVQHHMHFLSYYLNAEVRGDEGELYEMPDFIKQQITENEQPKTLGQKADALAIKITKQYDKLWVKVLFFTLVFCIFYMTR
jgi:hypothetical protein